MKYFSRSGFNGFSSAKLYLFFIISLCASNSFAQTIHLFPGSDNAGFNGQYGIAVDDTGNVFAGDYNNSNLVKITPFGNHNIFKTSGGPVGVVFDNAGNMYVTEYDSRKIDKISPSGIVTKIDSGGLLSGPEGIAIDVSNTFLYVTNWNTNQVFKITISTGDIAVIANTLGNAGNIGDGGPATVATFGAGNATFGNLEEVAVDSFNNIYIADPFNNRVRVIAGNSTSRHPVIGYIYPFAGTGTAGNSGDGAAATDANLNYPSGVRVDRKGKVYIADKNNNTIRMVDTAGIITTFAGTGVATSTGDLGPANAATLNGPYGLAFDTSGNLYISEQGGNRIRVVTFNCTAPVIKTVPSSQAVCEGTNLSLNTSATGSFPIGYQWRRNGANVGANNSTYNIPKVSLGDSGHYDVMMVNFCGAASTTPAAALTVNPLPVTAGTIVGNASVCKGSGGLVYSIPAVTNATGYDWTVPTGGTIVSGTNTDSITVDFSSSALSGSVTVSGKNGCGNGNSSVRTIALHSLPDVNVTKRLDTICKGSTAGLTATGALTYSWSPETGLNNTTGSFVGAFVDANITYTLTGVDANGCTDTATAAVIVEICTGITAVNDEETSIYPNPSNGLFSVTISQPAEGKAELFNLTGQKVYEENFSNEYKRDFNLAGNGSGMYILQITSGETIWRRKIVVQ